MAAWSNPERANGYERYLQTPQKLKMTFIPKAWRELNRGLWATPRGEVNTLAGLGSAVSALAAMVMILIVKLLPLSLWTSTRSPCH